MGLSSVFAHSILDHGAVPDGRTLCTQAIQGALDAAGKAGGGHVIVPPGTYLTGTLFPRSNTKLELMAGATLLGSPKHEDYPLKHAHEARRVPWKDKKGRRHLLYLEDVHHVTLCGQGSIHGNDEAFWKMEGLGPNQWIPAKPDRVSNMIQVVDSRDISIQDLFLTHSPEWTLHLLDCDRVKIRGIRIKNNFYGPNNDGIDITGCHDVLISDCDIDTSDDAICLKTFPESRTCERICVTNCTLRTNCVAVKVGTETWKDIRGFTIQNCIVRESTRAFGLYSHRGGTIQDVIISNIVFDSDNNYPLNRPIHIDLNNRDHENVWGQGPVGRIRNVKISNFISRSDGRVLMTAKEGHFLENVSLTDLRMYYPDPGRIDDPDPIGLDSKSEQWPHYAEGRTVRAAVIAENIRGFRVRDLEIDWPQGVDSAPFNGLWCKGVRDAVVDAPLLKASHQGHPAVAQVESEVRVKP